MYAKVFRSIYEGSLGGDWRALVTFQQFLILADRFGVVDMTPEAIVRITGVPEDIILPGIQSLQKVDPRSRTPDDDGRRIVLLDAHRDWGWRVPNYQKYRAIERHDQRREYMRDYMQKKRALTRVNSISQVSAIADAEADAEAEATQKKARTRKASPAPTLEVPGLNTEAWNRWVGYRRQIGRALKEASLEAAAKRLAQHGEHQAAIVEQSIANGWQGLFELKAPMNGKAVMKPRIKLKTAEEYEAEGR